MGPEAGCGRLAGFGRIWLFIGLPLLLGVARVFGPVAAAVAAAATLVGAAVWAWRGVPAFLAGPRLFPPPGVPALRTTPRTFWTCLATLVVVAGLVHAVVCLGGPFVYEPDSSGYDQIAQVILGGTFHLRDLAVERTPGYPLFVAAVQWAFPHEPGLPLKILQHVLDLGSQVFLFLCAYWISGRVFLALTASLCSLAAVHSLAYANSLMTETLYKFFLTFFVAVCVKALLTRKGWLIALAMLLCACLAWIRPSSKVLWMLPLFLFAVRSLADAFSADAPGSLAGRAFAALKRCVLSRNMAWMALGTALFFAALAPLLQNTYRRTGEVALGDGVGKSLWYRVMYYDRIENADNPELARFIAAYNDWAAVNDVEAAGKGMDWRYNYLTQKLLHDLWGFTPAQAHAWMLRMSLDGIRHHFPRFVGMFLQDLPDMLTATDSLEIYFWDADDLKARYPFVLDMTARHEDYDPRPSRDAPRTGSYLDACNVAQPAFFQTAFLGLADLKQRLMQHYEAQDVWFLLLLGLVGGIFLYEPFSFLLLLLLVAYHIAVPLLVLPPTNRYRLPVEPYLFLVGVAVPFAWGLLLRRLRLPMPGRPAPSSRDAIRAALDVRLETCATRADAAIGLLYRDCRAKAGEAYADAVREFHATAAFLEEYAEQGREAHLDGALAALPPGLPPGRREAAGMPKFLARALAALEIRFSGLKRCVLATPLATYWARMRLIAPGLALVCLLLANMAWHAGEALLTDYRQRHFQHDLVAGQTPKNWELAGLGGLEKNGQGRPYRWGFGPATEISFFMPATKEVRIGYDVVDPAIDGQTLALEVNGETLTPPRAIPKQPDTAPALPGSQTFKAKAGKNTVRLVYGDWNHGRTTFASGDPRPFALVFFRLDLQTVN